MQGVVDFFWQFAPGVSPHCFERSDRFTDRISDRFESRLRELTRLLSDPVLMAAPNWYPDGIRVACWRRNNKTLCLILERSLRHGGTAIRLWCVTDDEMTTLMDAARSRHERVAAVADFDQFFHRQIERLSEPSRDQFLHFKMLVDDLTAIPGRALPLLVGKLGDANGEVRCATVDVLLGMEGKRGITRVLPLFEDPLQWVRWHVVGCMANHGDDSVVEPLIAKLNHDPDPGVRGQAAFALGHIGSPQAIPSLLHALDHDREADEQGHSPSSIAATALDDILGTNQTRIKLEDGFCKMAPWPTDFDELKARAGELFRNWKPERDH